MNFIIFQGIRRRIYILSIFVSFILSGMKSIGCDIRNNYDLLPNQNKGETIKAKFFFHPAMPLIGQKIYFYNASTGDPDKYFWNFGDGQISQDKSPSHKYFNPSLYYITLRISKGNLTSQLTIPILIKKSFNLQDSGYEPLKADFYYEPEKPEVGVPVKFYDRSTGNPSKRKWLFGYFGISLLPNPIRTYFSEGKRAVTLIVENQAGVDRVSKYIEVIPNTSKNIKVAKSCSLKDIEDAINSSSSGDTVIVPAGQASWSHALVVTKGIILKAALPGGVTIRSGAASGSNYADPANFLIAYIPDSNNLDQPFRLSGFVLDGNNNRFPFLGMNTYLTPITKLRVDHCELKNSVGSVMVFVGEVYGVVDNNIIRGGNSFVTRDFGLNATSWNNFTFNFGTADNRYYEDNVVYMGEYGAFTEGGLGGRYCVRYCEIIHTGSRYCLPFDMHGNYAGGNHATMGAECYENSIDGNGKSLGLADIRGGKALVYNNRMTNCYGGGIQIREEDYDYNNPPPTNPAGQPQHVSETYIFNNTLKGNQVDAYISSTLDYGGSEGIVPRWNVHCLKHVANFDGTTGVGVGPLSQRPATCSSEGVAWWATDENKLYRWKNGRWELYYVPYTYPHPLRTILGD